MDSTIKNFISKNSTVIATLFTYALCLSIVLIFGGEMPLERWVMIGAGFIAVLGYGCFRGAREVYGRLKAGRTLSVSRIANVLRGMGIPTVVTPKGQIEFQYQFPGITWRLLYDETSGKLKIALVFPMKNSDQEEIAQRGAAAVMPGNWMVRIYLKPVEDGRHLYLSIDTMVYSLEDFKHFISDYLDALIKAMKEHDTICRKIAEEYNTSHDTPKIGFFSPMQEKIRAFDKENPDATAAERKTYIEKLRKS